MWLMGQAMRGSLTEVLRNHLLDGNDVQAEALLEITESALANLLLVKFMKEVLTQMLLRNGGFT